MMSLFPQTLGRPPRRKRVRLKNLFNGIEWISFHIYEETDGCRKYIATSGGHRGSQRNQRLFLISRGKFFLENHGLELLTKSLMYSRENTNHFTFHERKTWSRSQIMKIWFPLFSSMPQVKGRNSDRGLGVRKRG